MKRLTWKRPTAKTVCFPERYRRQELQMLKVRAFGALEQPWRRKSPSWGLRKRPKKHRPRLAEVVSYPQAQVRGGGEGPWRRSPEQSHRQNNE